MYKLVNFLRSIKAKIKTIVYMIRYIYIRLVHEDRLRKNEKAVIELFVKMLGRYPEDKWAYVNAIALGSTNIDMLKQRLMMSKEYKDRIQEYCRMNGLLEEYLPQEFIPPNLPGDPLFVQDKAGLADELIGKAENAKKSVTLVSTWKIRCGIATYTEYLAREINKLGLCPNIVSVNDGIPDNKVTGKIVHLQHEFGIMPKLIKTDSRILVTWHTVTSNIGLTIGQFEKNGNIAGHIVHSREIADYLKTLNRRGNIHVIDHGSKIIAQIAKEEARQLLGTEMLGIKHDDKFGFVFGFQSRDKKYDELVAASHRLGIKLVISGAPHECGHTSDVAIKDNVVFLFRYLNDTEIDLWALASNILLFDYEKQKHYSVSGAMHRIIGAGRPVVCSRTNHFTDVRENEDVLKFDGQKELEQKIEEGLGDSQKLGKCALEYAKNSSWQNAARKHLDLYKSYTDLSSIPDTFDASYYDKAYFALNKGKSFYNSDGSIGHWSYANPEGEWKGCEPIVQAWKKMFCPKNALDAGCGRGTFIGYMRSAGIEAQGFDFSDFAVNNPYLRCNREWIAKKDAVQVPWGYKDSAFDLVIALDLMEHIYQEDIDKIINEICRVTGKYAFLLIAVIKGSQDRQHEKGYILKKEEGIGDGPEAVAVAGHVTMCDKAYWMEKFKRGGWRPRTDMVEEFCRMVPKDVIASWLLNAIIIFEKTP